MKLEFFGDSYDIVKRFLLSTLAPAGTWHAFPMFTHEVAAADVAAFEQFLGVTVVRPDVLALGVDRKRHLELEPHQRYVFFDPDTGIKLDECSGLKGTHYIFGPELVQACAGLPERLVLVFDQANSHGGEREAIVGKLQYFANHGLYSLAYLSHACFVVLSGSQSVADEAGRRLVASGLPEARIIAGPCA